MKKKEKKNSKIIKIKIVISVILIGILFLSFLFSDEITQFLNLKFKISNGATELSVVEKSDYYVSYINVGQGNSCYIKLPDGKNMLIDGGNIEYGETVSNYLKSHNVEKLDYLIATHSDSDHIGGLNQVLDDFEVKNIYRPFEISGVGASQATFIPNEKEDLSGAYNYISALSSDNKVTRVTTEVYKKFINKTYTETYIESGVSKTCDVSVFYDGLKIVGENYKFEFFAPLLRSDELNLEDYSTRTSGMATKCYGVSDSNNNSAIFLFNCFNESYVFTGDAVYQNASGKYLEEYDFIHSLTESEKQMFKNATALLLGHHGSKYSTGSELLELIQPEFIVISSGNKYGHPSEETLKRINKFGFKEANILRTDTLGSILISESDEKVVYASEKENKLSQITITYELLSSILVGLIIILLFSIKPKKRKVKIH